MLVTRVEKHNINKNHELYKFCDEMCFKSKNLYNYANYLVRQEFIHNKKFIGSSKMDSILKKDNQADYRNLPIQASQQTLRLLEKNWNSFLKSIKDWSKNKSKYNGKPNLPKYKKKNGRQVVMFTNQQCKIRNGFINFPKSKLTLKTKVTNLQQIRILPNGGDYKIEVVYNKKIPDRINMEPTRIISVDLGLNNFATIVNNIGLQPIVIEGKIIKSINQYYNKKKAKFMHYIGGKGISNRLIKLTNKRNNKVDDYMHKSSRKIIHYCIKNNIDTIILGHNKQWKQDINTGKINNQKFVNIPFNILIEQLQYKAEDKGINVIITEESYTSKSSFLDKDDLPEYKEGMKHKFSGCRIKRGLYKSKNGILINADCNGAYNIMRKVIPNLSLNEGIEGMGLYPIRINPSSRNYNKDILLKVCDNI